MKKLLATGGGASTIPAQGVDFDGTNDYLSRSSDLVGNVDSKTFTFSAWVYFNASQVSKIISYIGGGGFQISMDGASQLTILGKNSAGTTILSAYVPTANFVIPINTFVNIKISADMSNTANRSIYIGDTPVTATWSKYTNDLIDFTSTAHSIPSNGSKISGRLSNVFLSHQYIDLSVEANRRIFINEDGTAVT